MSSIPELFNSTTDAVKNRLSHPLLGSFVISWLIFNWKPIYYLLFADDKVVYKLKSISENYSSFETLVCLPLLSTFALATFIPTLSLIYGFFLKFIDYIEVRVKYFFKYKTSILHEKYAEQDNSKFEELKKDKELADRNYHRSEMLIEKLTPLVAKVEIPIGTLQAHLSKIELTKLEILEFLSKNKDHSVDYDHLEIAIDSDRLMQACSELKARHLIEAGQALLDIQSDTNIEITDDGIIEIANMKVTAFRKEMRMCL